MPTHEGGLRVVAVGPLHGVERADRVFGQDGAEVGVRRETDRVEVREEGSADRIRCGGDGHG